MTVERTLFILKPEATMRRYIGAKVLERLASEEFGFFGMGERMVPKSLAEAHYAIHVGKPFYPWLIKFITAGPVIPLIIEGRDVISRIRELLGSTMVQKADPDTLRGQYGIWGGINIAHASDSLETAQAEIALWISQGKLDSMKPSKQEIMSYCGRWGDKPINYTPELRHICSMIVAQESNPLTLKNAETQLATYLGKECIGFKTSEVKNLARLILEHLALTTGTAQKAQS